MLNERNTLLEDDGIEEEILVEEECSVAQAVWGDIQGNIENQTDLQNVLDGKQDSLTEAQLNAVNSGITAEKVTTYDGYADQIASKANQSALSAEATTREQADTALGRRIDDEATARQQADDGLQTQIDAITSQSDVVDVVANYAALQAYDTSSLSDNDVIKVLDDETHEDALTYYRWSTTTQTWSYIGQEAPYYSKGQMDVMLQGKQDKLTAGSNIQISNNTISATDTTYTAGNGLNLNGTEFSADTDVLATKEDLEGYYTKPETDNLLAPKLEAEVVAELPTTGEEGKLYLTPKAHTTQTATGNPITATVAEDAGAFESFQLDGDTFQQTYTGKNLFTTKNGTVQVSYATWSDTDSGETIIVDGINDSNHYDFAMFEVDCGPGEYTLSAENITSDRTIANNERMFLVMEKRGDAWTQTKQILYPSISGTLTLPEGTTSIRIALYGPWGAKLTYDKVQLEAGSSRTSFEPYVGGTPSPNPDYPQPIQVVTGEQVVEVHGKNLFDKNHPNNSKCYVNPNGVLKSGDSQNLSVYIKCEPNTTYTVSKSNKGTNNRFCVFNTEAEPAIGVSVIGTVGTRSGEDNSSSYTITTGANAHYLGVFYRAAATTPSESEIKDTIQIEKGSTPTAYAPYSKQTYPLALGTIELCKLDTYQDYIWKDGDDWKVHKATATLILSGESSENWYIDQYAYMLNGVISAKPFSDIANMGAYCNSFSKSATGQVSRYVVSFWYNATGTGVRFIKDQTPDLSGFRNWLASNNQTVYYPLATATDTVITDQTLIAQLEAIRTASLQNGANTITNTATGSNLAGDMEIGYYGFAPRNRYDKWLWLDINNEYEQIGS